MEISKQLRQYARERFQERLLLLEARQQEIRQGMKRCTEEVWS